MQSKQTGITSSHIVDFIFWGTDFVSWNFSQQWHGQFVQIVCSSEFYACIHFFPLIFPQLLVVKITLLPHSRGQKDWGILWNLDVITVIMNGIWHALVPSGLEQEVTAAIKLRVLHLFYSCWNNKWMHFSRTETMKWAIYCVSQQQRNRWYLMIMKPMDPQRERIPWALVSWSLGFILSSRIHVRWSSLAWSKARLSYYTALLN